MVNPPGRDQQGSAGSDRDTELVTQAQNELPYVTDAYEALMRRNQSLILRVCRRWLGNDADALDATQEAMLRVFRHLSGFKGESTFRTWLFRVVTNVCRTQLRKRIRHEEWFSLGDVDARGSDATIRSVDSRIEIERLLDQLSESDREILVLRFVGNLDISDIASVLGMKLSATKMRLYRAMERIKDVAS